MESGALKFELSSVRSERLDLLDAIEEAVRPVKGLNELLCLGLVLDGQLKAVVSILDGAVRNLDFILKEARQL